MRCAPLRAAYSTDTRSSPMGTMIRDSPAVEKGATRSSIESVRHQSLAHTLVPLLARHRGNLVFAVAPFVADDPVLGEIWETSYPILDADRDVRRLQRCLGLRRLDDEVRLRPKPLQSRPELRDKLERVIARRGRRQAEERRDGEDQLAFSSHLLWCDS